MADLQAIADQLSELTLLEAADLTKILEEKWGVSAAAPMAAMAMMPGGGAAEAVEEKTEFDVVLKEIGAKKIQVIKAVRGLRSDLGLKEAKAVVDSAPTAILEAVPKDQAEESKAKLEAAGAVVEIK